MSKKTIILLTLFIGVSLFIFSCGSSGPSEGYIKGEKQIMEGWVDDDHFRVRAEGYWGEEEQGKPSVVRRNSAREAAKLLAQGQAIEKFVGFALQGVGMTKVSGEGAKGYIEKRFGGYIKGGSIVEEEWNDKEGISIVYEVYSPGLKNQVTTIFKNLTPAEKKEIFGE